MKTDVLEIRGVRFGAGIPKICVPVVKQTYEMIKQFTEDAMCKMPDLIELRIDWFEEWTNDEAVLRLLEDLRVIIGETVLLFTMRTNREGGQADISEEDYIRLCTLACESGYVDLIDVEAFMSEDILRKISEIAHANGVHVVGSNHDFEKTPDEQELVRRLEYMVQNGADIPKIAVMPVTERDVLTLLSATLQYREKDGKKPVITISMGDMGVISRIAGEVFGSAVTFAIAGEASAPGQIAVKDIRPILDILHTEG